MAAAGVAFDVMELELGDRRFDISHRSVVVGMVRPDTANGGDLVACVDALVAAGVDAVDLGGVDLGGVDLGGVELVPGGVVGAVGLVRSAAGLPLWVTTGSASVAAACVEAGADVVVDPTGFSDPGLLAACAAAGASVVVSGPGGDITVSPRDAVASACERLEGLVARAVAAGIPAERIMVDPAGDPVHRGFPFGLGLQVSQVLADRGHRVVVSVVTGHTDTETDTGPGTSGPDSSLGPGGSEGRDVAIQALAVARGCRIVRTNDVRVARRVTSVVGAVLEHR